VVGVLGGDLVAEVSRRTGAGVCDQCLVLGEFQREVITQERGEASLDLLGFDLRSDEPQEVIVCVSAVLQPPVARISGIPAGQAAKLLAQLAFQDVIAMSAGTPHGGSHLTVGGVFRLPVSSGVLRNEILFDELVQPVQINIGKDW
jgi:hypothetical protein